MKCLISNIWKNGNYFEHGQASGTSIWCFVEFNPKHVKSCAFFSPNSIHQQFNCILHEGATWCTARRSTGAQVRQKEARARGSHLNKVAQPLKLRMGTGAPQMAAHQTSQLEHPIHQTSQLENPKSPNLSNWEPKSPNLSNCSHKASNLTTWATKSPNPAQVWARHPHNIRFHQTLCACTLSYQTFL